jgi:hypothetical protein
MRSTHQRAEPGRQKARTCPKFYFSDLPQPRFYLLYSRRAVNRKEALYTAEDAQRAGRPTRSTIFWLPTPHCVP